MNVLHSYLRAIGFSKIKTQEQLDELIEVILDTQTSKKLIHMPQDVLFGEITMEFGADIGISIRGEYNEKGEFYLEHYYPYFYSDQLSASEEIIIHKKVDTESYTGMCDDGRIGVSLIFYIQNIMDYIEKYWGAPGINEPLPIYLSGLSLQGKVLLGIDNREKDNQASIHELKRKNQLIAEAKRGNQEAIDSLTIDDIDLYAMIMRRARNEDVYSIVESSFIPFGSESDNYTILGTIVDVKKVKNQHSKEEIYQLLVECNHITFRICINKMDLLGEPKVGRRFKGNIWMQGRVDFN